MATVILDRELAERLKAERAASGADRYDEVWEGTYMMSPMPNDEHQELVIGFSSIFHTQLGLTGLASVRPGVNVSDRDRHWKENYRVPDVAVFMHGGTAIKSGAYWKGGPDFAIEIVSDGDNSREKFDFYGSVGVRELLIVDRYPWQLELYQSQNGMLRITGTSNLENAAVLSSGVIPFTFQLVAGEERPQIRVVHTRDQQNWLV